MNDLIENSAIVKPNTMPMVIANITHDSYTIDEHVDDYKINT